MLVKGFSLLFMIDSKKLFYFNASENFNRLKITQDFMSGIKTPETRENVGKTLGLIG